MAQTCSHGTTYNLSTHSHLLHYQHTTRVHALTHQLQLRLPYPRTLKLALCCPLAVPQASMCQNLAYAGPCKCCMASAIADGTHTCSNPTPTTIHEPTTQQQAATPPRTWSLPASNYKYTTDDRQGRQLADGCTQPASMAVGQMPAKVKRCWLLFPAQAETPLFRQCSRSRLQASHTSSGTFANPHCNTALYQLSSGAQAGKHTIKIMDLRASKVRS